MSGRNADVENDPFDLDRFVRGQASNYDQAIRELRDGRKRSHWMWYVFPQLDGLGFSSTAKYYGLKGTDEARAYWAHPVLGPRLRECCEALLALEGKTAHEIFGSPDDLKLRSSATLFAATVPGEPLFEAVLRKYYRGERDEKTLSLLKAKGVAP